jgi:AbrB family looped-hinge helix DNA binding protein
MVAVTVSPKYQVVIPRAVRERMNIKLGEKLQVICFDYRIELLPVRPIQELKGFLDGYDSSIERDEEDRV